MCSWRDLSLGIAFLALAGCLPIPDMRAPLELPAEPYALDPAQIETEYVTLDGYEVPGTPAHLNKTFYLRYYAETLADVSINAPTNTPADTTTDTVLVLMPGFFGGAANLDTLARQLVASRAGLEVWAIDRRANALEDRSAALSSLHSGDPNVAYRYYVGDALTPKGFTPLSPDEVPFLRRWGLEAHLRDLHEVVKRANVAAETVVLGGHSLGASLVSLYAAFRFDEGLGDTLLDALVLLDGTLGRTGAFGFADGLALGNWEVVPDASGYDEGRGLPFLPFGAGPDYFARREAVALLAALEPEALSPGGFYSFPISNLAVFGLQADRNFVLSPIFSSSVGEPVGARYGGNLVAFLLDGWGGRGSRTVSGVADGFERVEWSPGDPTLEHTDIYTLAASSSLPETNLNEWYFPLRLFVDISALPLDLRDHQDFAAHREVSVPTLAIGGERGLVSSLDGFSAYSNLRSGALFSSYIIPDYAHLDLINAAENPVVPLVSRWLSQVTQLRRSAERP